MYIACPKCDWRPNAGSKWYCTCSHSWNTFATQGVCPACGKVWAVTQCLACHRWSDHLDWYHDEDDLSVDEYIANPETLREPFTACSQVQF
jgi:hypothetical protein